MPLDLRGWHFRQVHGHSVEILLKIYAKCLDGEADHLRRRLETVFNDSIDPDEPEESAP